jgi:hypothetical protein
MSARRSIVYFGLAIAFAVLCFGLGSLTAHGVMARQIERNDAEIAALRDEMARSILAMRQSVAARPPAATDGQHVPQVVPTSGEPSAAVVEEIKKQLQQEMGLLPVRLLRERRSSFVELNAIDNTGKSSYGTAGYLGHGYFITVKHAVVMLDDEGNRPPRRMASISVRYKGHDLPARIVDTGNADIEVHPGDWAVIKVAGDVELPALRVDTNFGFDFADPIFRLGNDYSKGIILGTGYIGQRTPNGLVTCLTDGHPGVSGGGVLDQGGDLVGIPIGRMQGDYRFSFILPLRSEMFRKVPVLTVAGSAD